MPSRLQLRVSTEDLAELDRIAPPPMPVAQIPGLMTGEALIEELHGALAGSADDLVALLERNDIPVLDADGRQALRGLYATFDPAKPLPSSDVSDAR